MMENTIKKIIIEPQNEIQKRIFDLWSEELQADGFSIDDSFFEIGGQSLQAIPMVQKIEKEFQQEINLYSFFTNPTITGLEKLLEESANQNSSTEDEDKNGRSTPVPIKNFAPLKPEGGRVPFIMVHGDNSNIFLPKLLEKEQPFYGFLHLGSEGEKFTFKNVSELAAYYIEQLLAYKPEGPYLLGGHSFGGVVAYEMAVQLTKKGYQVPLLILSDSIIPERIPLLAFKRGIKFRVRRDIKRLKCDLNLFFNNSVPVPLRNFYILDCYERIGYNYAPPKYDGQVLLIRASLNDSDKEYLDWDKWAKQIKKVELEGSHNEIIINESTIYKYADIINKELTLFQP